MEKLERLFGGDIGVLDMGGGGLGRACTETLKLRIACFWVHSGYDI